jgi:hypothetical protein
MEKEESSPLAAARHQILNLRLDKGTIGQIAAMLQAAGSSLHSAGTHLDGVIAEAVARALQVVSIKLAAAPRNAAGVARASASASAARSGRGVIGCRQAARSAAKRLSRAGQSADRGSRGHLEESISVSTTRGLRLRMQKQRCGANLGLCTCRGRSLAAAGRCGRH